MFLPVRRATILIPSGPALDPTRKHLFILLTDPVATSAAREKQVLLVGISTHRPDLPHDPTCILYPADHPFVTKASFVNYARARTEDAKKLVSGVQTGLLVPREPLESGIFARVCKGLSESRHTPQKILSFYYWATNS